MKKYFVTYVASNDPIQPGDTITSELGTYTCSKISERKNRTGKFVHCEGLSGSHPISNWKKLALTLCCRDVKPGSNFVFQADAKTQKILTAKNSKENDKNWVHATDDWLYNRAQCFATLGPISKAAQEFVQDKQEFEENQIALSSGASNYVLQDINEGKWNFAKNATAKWEIRILDPNGNFK